GRRDLHGLACFHPLVAFRLAPVRAGLRRSLRGLVVVWHHQYLFPCFSPTSAATAAAPSRLLGGLSLHAGQRPHALPRDPATRPVPLHARQRAFGHRPRPNRNPPAPASAPRPSSTGFTGGSHRTPSAHPPGTSPSCRPGTPAMAPSAPPPAADGPARSPSSASSASYAAPHAP